MKITAVQMACTPGDIPGNLARMEKFARQAAASGTRLVLFPEVADIGYDFNAIREYGPEAWQHVAPKMSALAAELGVCLVCGVCHHENNQLFNTLTAWGPEGRILAQYRKVHLFSTPNADESKVFAPGRELTDFSFEGMRFGLTVCYDLRFPEIFRAYTLGGCHVLLLASAWPAVRIAHWQTLTTARAVENQNFLLAANRVGSLGAFPFGGGSVLLAPNGECIDAADAETESMISGEVSLEALATARNAIPALVQRCPESYARYGAK